MGNIRRRVEMKCGVCGNDQFSLLDPSIGNIADARGTTKVKCSDCGAITSKDQLIALNRHVIEANVEDIKKEALKKLKEDLKKKLR